MYKELSMGPQNNKRP